jgi:hypothetical protein
MPAVTIRENMQTMTMAIRVTSCLCAANNRDNSSNKTKKKIMIHEIDAIIDTRNTKLSQYPIILNNMVETIMEQIANITAIVGRNFEFKNLFILLLPKITNSSFLNIYYVSLNDFIHLIQDHRHGVM